MTIFTAASISAFVLLAWSTYTLVKRIRLVVSSIVEIVSGGSNVRQRLSETGNDELTDLSRAYNQFIGNIEGVVDMVIEASTSLASEASQMSGASESTRERVSFQQQQLQDVAGAIEDMSHTMDEITASAVAAAAAEQAKTGAQDGRQVVSTTITAIDDLATEVEDVSVIIERLADESSNIGSVLSTIRTISEQTNLLALNAAIEAARAGESGRGFSVVADEVRSLSLRIQSETEDIQKKIAQLQTEAGVAVAAMLKGRDKAHKTVEHAQLTGEALEGITSSVGTINDMNSKIAGAIEAQTDNAGRISHTIVSISEISNESANSAGNASKFAHEMSLMAFQLQGLVQQFLLTDNAASATAGSPGDEPAVRCNESASVAGDVELF